MTLKQLQVAVLDQIYEIMHEPVVDREETIVELFGEVDGQEDHSPDEQGSSGQRSEGFPGKSKA
jgi:hypothetical protein